MNRDRLIGLCLVAGVVASACGSPPAAPDKAGTETLTLKAAAVDGINVNGQTFGPQAFLDTIAKESGGHLKIDLTEHFAGQDPDRERQYTKALQADDIDIGWPNARSLADAGVDGFQALEAPMTITSYAALKAVLQSPVAGKLLARMDNSGIKGLGIVMGPLRRPFAGKAPLLGPEDWKGASLRATSPVERDVFTALGAEPIAYEADFSEGVLEGVIRGGLFDIAQADQNGITGDKVPFVTANVVLWPKLPVLSISEKRWDTLSDQQRAWITAAANDAVKDSLGRDYDESTMAKELCDQGVRLVVAGDAQIAAMNGALKPIVDSIAADPVTGPLLAGIRQATDANPGVEDPDVPADCRNPDIAAEASPGIPQTDAPIPNGTYRLAAADGTWTYVFKDGIYTLTCSFKNDPTSDCGGSGVDNAMVEAGFLKGDTTQVWMIIDANVMHEKTGCKLPASHALGFCEVWPPYGFTWSLAGKTLTLTALKGVEEAGEYERIDN
jgi:TRAP-type C4-dicarboxylate transport system substrate-binding protein